MEQDLLVLENQISFDFTLSEESTMLSPEALSQPKIEWLKEEVLFVVVETSHQDLSPAYDQILLCGRSLTSWVQMAGAGCEQVVIADCKDIISALKQIKTDKKYMAVFYSDTPLVSKSLFGRIMNYFMRSRMNAMALPRGFVFKVDFLRTMENFVSACLDTFDEVAFTEVDNPAALARANKILQQRIITYHERVGVVFVDKQNLVIDADVSIEEGAVIYGNNIIKGSSNISSSTVLEEGNIVVSSILGPVTLLGCRVTESKLTKSGLYICQDIQNKEI